MNRVLVLGLGVSGRAASGYLLDKGAAVVGVDKSPRDLKDLEKRGLEVRRESEPVDVSGFDLVVTSPGIAPSHPWLAAARKAGLEVIGEIELACRDIRGNVLAITGTNGKTTVTLLTAHILQQAGINALAVGNVGKPLSSLVHLDPDVWVVELSSYQLETMSAPVVDVGVILNITPDHLDRYPDMEAYAAAKFRLAQCIKPGGKLFVEEKCMKRYRGSGCTYGFTPECDLYCDGERFIMKTIEYLLPKEYRGCRSHEVENLMACFALCQKYNIAEEQMTEAVRQFKKPPHRIEFVLNRDGVNYYNDSKGTNLDAVIRAVQAMRGDVVLIAGGLDKGSSYLPWIDGFQGRVKGICAIGQAAAKLVRELGDKMPVTIFSTLEEAVRQAAAAAKPGDNVLLSPGCASFDMFRDYEHRGDEFKRVVQALGAGHEST